MATSEKWVLRVIITPVVLAVVYACATAITSNKRVNDWNTAKAAADARLAESNAKLGQIRKETDEIEAQLNEFKPEFAIPKAEREFEQGDYANVVATLAKLSKEDRRRPNVRKMIDQAEKETGHERLTFAEEYEKQHLGIGEDYIVSVIGPNNTMLTIKYGLVSRPFAYQMGQDYMFMRKLKGLGFRRVLLSNEFEGPWTLTLDPK